MCNVFSVDCRFVSFVTCSDWLCCVLIIALISISMDRVGLEWMILGLIWILRFDRAAEICFRMEPGAWSALVASRLRVRQMILYYLLCCKYRLCKANHRYRAEKCFAARDDMCEYAKVTVGSARRRNSRGKTRAEWIWIEKNTLI